MGMSASQARMLSLTSRLSDLELTAQSISNSKIRLADQSEAASKEYSEALDKQKLTAFSGVDNNSNRTYVDANVYNLTGFHILSDMDKQRFVKDQAGRVLVMDNVGAAYDDAAGNLAAFLAMVVNNPAAPDYAARIEHYTNVFNEIQESGGYNPIGDNNMMNSEWLQAQIEAGNLFLVVYDKQAYDEENERLGDFVDVSWTSGDPSLQEKDDKTELARAEAKYETTMASIQAKDKRFDLQLKEIDTEHKAIETEIDSVKKVIDKNIDRSFKVFNA